MLVHKRYRLGPLLGKGAFAEDIVDGEKWAVKMERRDTRVPQLLREARILKLLGASSRSLGIPRVKWCGQDQERYNVMVMELLGENLETLLERCGGRFSLKTTLMLADQMLRRVEFIHSKHFLHRDIKPDNFLMGGTARRAHLVYVIDFGLSKKFMHRGVHIPMREGKRLTGTPRYASINNHLGLEQGRRDDLEAVAYMLIYFLKGRLPWQGLPARTKDEKYARILEVKMSTPVEELCLGLPHEFIEFLEQTRNLRFNASPNMQQLRRLFTGLFERRGLVNDYLYDWMIRGQQRQRRGGGGSGSGTGGTRGGPQQGRTRTDRTREQRRRRYRN